MSPLEQLQCPDPGLRYRAFYHYYRHGLGDDRAGLATLASTTEEEGVANTILSVIWHHPHSDFRDVLRRLHERFPNLRVKTVLGFGRLGDKESLLEIVAGCPEIPVELAAISALARLNSGEVVEYLSRRAVEWKDWRGPKSLQLLTQMGHPEGLRLAVEQGLLNLDSPKDRFQGRRVISWICRSGYPREQLERALKGLTPEQRVLLQGGRPVRPPDLSTSRGKLEAYARDGNFAGLVAMLEDGNIADQALSAMIALDRKQAEPHLRRLLLSSAARSGYDWLALNHINVFRLQEMSGDLTLYIEQQFGKEKPRQYLSLGIRALSQFVGNGCLPLVRLCLDHGCPETRKLGVDFVAQFDDRACEERLMRLLDKDEDARVALAAASVLADWQVQSALDSMLRRLRERGELALARPAGKLDRSRAIAELLAQPDTLPDADCATYWTSDRHNCLLELHEPGAVQQAYRTLLSRPAERQIYEAECLCALGLDPPIDEICWDWLGQAQSWQDPTDYNATDHLEGLVQVKVIPLLPLLMEWAEDRGVSPQWQAYEMDSDLRSAAFKGLAALAQPAVQEAYKGAWVYGLLLGGEASTVLHQGEEPWGLDCSAALQEAWQREKAAGLPPFR